MLTTWKMEADKALYSIWNVWNHNNLNFGKKLSNIQLNSYLYHRKAVSMSSTSSQFSVNVYTFPYGKKTFKTFELLLIYIVKMHPLSHDDAHTNTNTNTHTHTYLQARTCRQPCVPDGLSFYSQVNWFFR